MAVLFAGSVVDGCHDDDGGGGGNEEKQTNDKSWNGSFVRRPKCHVSDE
jgi:hypothetical protein